jgi:hypothetical protein
MQTTKFLKPLGCDGTQPLDIEATPFNSHGFTFTIR